MTKRELLHVLAPYPDDTPILDGRKHDLHAHHIDEVKCDDWEHSTPTDDGYEIPGVVIGLSLGPRF